MSDTERTAPEDAGAGTGDRTEGTDRTPVEEPRADETPEWEVFLRESPCEPLRHAGSVTARTAERAHERTERLFPEAGTVWLCPAAELARFTERDLGAAYAEEATEEPAETGAAAREGESR